MYCPPVFGLDWRIGGGIRKLAQACKQFPELGATGNDFHELQVEMYLIVTSFVL